MTKNETPTGDELADRQLLALPRPPIPPPALYYRL